MKNTVLRFLLREPISTWPRLIGRRLAHVDADEGDFTGSVSANTQVQRMVDTSGIIIAVTRYINGGFGSS